MTEAGTGQGQPAVPSLPPQQAEPKPKQLLPVLACGSGGMRDLLLSVSYVARRSTRAL